MTGLFRLLLVLTSLAPTLLIAGVGWWSTFPNLARGCVYFAGTLATICLVLVWFVRRAQGFVALKITKATRSDKSVFPFMFAYVIPLLIPTTLSSAAQGYGNAPGLIAFVVVMAIVLYRTQLHDVNPVLSLFGYHFFEVDAGATATGILLLTRQARVPLNEVIRVKEISDYLWLHVETQDRAEVKPLRNGDTSRPTNGTNQRKDGHGDAEPQD